MASRKKQWTEEQEQILFNLQKEHGNRWSVIAMKLAPKNDSCVKNKFYSTLRKGLRKINKYIVEIKKKSDPVRLKGYKTLQQMFITKLIAVVDNNFEQKYEVKQKALELSQNIQKRVIEIACSSKQYLKQQITDYSMQEELLRDINQFNKSCKKRKGKRKSKQDSDFQSYNDEIELSHVLKQQNILATEYNQKDNCKNSSQNIDKNESFAKNSYLVPQTKQNIILTVENNSEIETEAKLKICSNSYKYTKKEDFYINQKKQSTSAIICNSASMFQKIEQPQIITDQNNIQNSTTFNMNASWLFESTNSRDLSKKMSGYLTHPSPLPSDNNNLFTFASFMKNNGFSNSGSFQQKTNPIQLLQTSKFYQNILEEKTISLLDQLPMYVPNSLIKSADMLQQSTQLINNSQSFNSSQNYKEFNLNGKQICNSMNFENKLNGTIQAFFPVFPNHDVLKPDSKVYAQQYNFTSQSLFSKKIEGIDGNLLQRKKNKLVSQNIKEQ